MESGSDLTSNGPEPSIPTQASQSAFSNDFEELDREMRSKLLRLAWVIVRDWSLAADAVQNSFLTLHQKWGQIQPEHRTGWLVKTVQYSAHNLRRSRSTSERLAGDLFNQTQSEVEADAPSGIEVEEQVQLALQQLPPLQRQIVQLKLVEGLTFQQISEQLSIPLGTALSRMRLALAKLRSVLKETPNE